MAGVVPSETLFISLIPALQHHPGKENVMYIEAVDVVIIGAGPGGSAFALSLQQHAPSLSIVLVEQSNFETPRIGETLPPGVQPLLEQVDAWDAFRAQQHQPAFSTRAAWGRAQFTDNDFLYYTSGTGWILERHQFDAMLARLAANRGAVLLTRSVLYKHWKTHEDFHMLQVQHSDGENRLFRARFVIDASGRKASYARKQGARSLSFDRLIGACGVFSFDSMSDAQTDGALIEAFAQGWWYTAPLGKESRIVACMTDSDLLKKLGLRHKECWLSLLQDTQEIKKTVAGGILSEEPVLRPSASQCLEVLCGDDWLAVGDAACCFDPLSSQGVMKALHSGIFASYAVADSLTRGVRTGLKNYERFIHQEFDIFLQFHAHYYAEEKRWQNQPFWHRRHQKIMLSPETVVVATHNKMPKASFLSRKAVRLISTICEQPQSAHAVVSQFREKFKEPFSDKRIILAIQHLLGTRTLEYRKTSAVKSEQENKQMIQVVGG